MKLATVIVLAQLQVYDCLPQYPGDDFAIGRQWSWQTVDGRRCWYPGPRRIPKDRLRWSDELEPPQTRVPEPPAQWELEHRWIWRAE